MVRVADGRVTVIPGLPNFNDADEAFKITRFDGWFDAAAPDAVLAPNGGGPGSVASGTWAPRQHAYTLAGRIQAPRAELADYRRLLLAAFPADVEQTVTVLGNGLDVDLETYVRRFEQPQITIMSQLDFVLSLVAPDPYRYSPAAGAETVLMGANTGQTWGLRWGRSGGVWGLQWGKSGGVWGAQASPFAPSTSYPTTAEIVSAGTAPSRRLTMAVTGPLTAGDWSITQEVPGGTAYQRQWVNLSVAAGQELVIDNYAETATLAGGDATRFVFGDWLTLEPGSNVYKLNVGTASAAYAAITRHQEAHQ